MFENKYKQLFQAMTNTKELDVMVKDGQSYIGWITHIVYKFCQQKLQAKLYKWRKLLIQVQKHSKHITRFNKSFTQQHGAMK